MKKVYKALFIAAGCLFTASCSNDNDYEAPVASINVLSADTYISAAGETKELVLDQTPAAAYAKDAWLTVSNDGTKVSLTAGENQSVQSRNTEVVIKSVAGDSIMVNVSQAGAVFSISDTKEVLSDDDAMSKTYSVVSNLSVSYSTTADWLTITNTSKAFTVAAAANDTGKPRVGYVKIKSGGQVDSIRFVQATVEDLEGDYRLVYRTVQNGNAVYRAFAAKIEAVGADSVSLTIGGRFVWKGVHEKGGILKLPALQNLGSIVLSGTTYYIAPLFVLDNNQLSLATDATLSVLVADDGVLEFAANNSLEGKTSSAFILGAFSSTTFNAANYVGNFASLQIPYLERTN